VFVGPDGPLPREGCWFTPCPQHEPEVANAVPDVAAPIAERGPSALDPQRRVFKGNRRTEDPPTPPAPRTAGALG
jgi:hypothetical protein